MKIHFNKKIYLVVVGLNILLSIQQWPERVRGGTPLFETAFSVLVLPIIYTLILSLLFTKKTKIVGKDGYTKLMELCSGENFEAIKIEIAINPTSINLQDKGGYTALMYAVAIGNFAIVEWLLNNGADKNIKTTNGNTATYFAEKNKHKNISDLLKLN